MSDNFSSRQTTKFEEALQFLRNIDKYGFGYGTGIPLPIQQYLLGVNKAYLMGLELIEERLKILSSNESILKEET